jgi:hypothetical protein
MVSILVSICIILINVKYMVSMLVYEEYWSRWVNLQKPHCCVGRFSVNEVNEGPIITQE